MSELHRTYGPVFRVQAPGGRHVTGLVGAEANAYVLVREHQNFASSGAFDYLKRLAPTSMLALDGEEHERLRRLLMPAVEKRRVGSYLSDMVRHTARALDRWPLGVPFDVAEKLRELTFGVVTKALLGLDTSDTRYDEMAKAVWVAAEYISPLTQSARNDPERVARFLRAKAVIDALIDGLIVERTASGEDHGDFLSMLLRMRQGEAGIDDAKVRDQMWTLLFAGHDTTAHAIAWTLYLLAQHPRERDLAVAELDRELGDRLPTQDDLPRLVYLDRVAQEAQRLYPSAPSIPRVVKERFEFGGYGIPAGDLVVLYLHLTHRLPEVFRDPDAFVPERWDPARGEAHPPFSYVPFGAGPRMCPGGMFALLEIKEVLSVALRRFTFELEPGQRIVAYAAAPAMRPVPGILMRVRPRRVLLRVDA
ncbi:MAG: cytochrome P450 [Candidatus Limnocylindria bacterium]|nr:cytochrome P450 [Candidatus Limnocylindria bacterium]